jgi:hypothetical protein
MRIYNPKPKQELPGQRGRKGSKLDLSVMEASQLLNDHPKRLSRMQDG